MKKEDISLHQLWQYVSHSPIFQQNNLLWLWEHAPHPLKHEVQDYNILFLISYPLNLIQSKDKKSCSSFYIQTILLLFLLNNTRKDMPHESRVKKSLLNARVNMIFYFLNLALSFFSRKIFLDTLGADFMGLTGTLLNLLGFLNLAELGIGMAIGYVLYKPLYQHDENKINEIISVFGYIYRWIGLSILGAGCLLACFCH